MIECTEYRMKILDLEQFGFFRDRRDVKVLRHKDTQKDLWAMRADNTFNKYQNGQSWDVFGDARYLISFIAERHKYGKFLGVWEVLSKSRHNGGYRYKTKELSGYKDLEERMIVSWGMGTRSWAQWLHRAGNKDISEIFPSNYIRDFPGFYEIVLTYDQLVRLVNNQESNREWHRMLSNSSGVYVLLDKISGRQYVGSAYGARGIWGRWKQYAKSPSGGNKLLKQLLEDYPNRYRHFQFSILRVLEPAIPKDAVIEQEVLVKKKLGSRTFGLNSN